MTMTYETDTRGRAGRYKAVAEPLPAPAASLAVLGFVTEERADGLHLVHRETGESYGVMATPRIAEQQLNALRRFST